MDYNNKSLELKIISATDLQKPTLFSRRTHPYVVVSLSSISISLSHSTPISPDGGTNPTWNHTITFPSPPPSAVLNTLILQFQIRRRSTFPVTPSKLIGEVNVPLLDLLSNQLPPPGRFVSYQIRTPAGKSKGVLTFSYRFTTPFDPLHPPTPADPPTKPNSHLPPSLNSHPPAEVYPPVDLPGKLYPPLPENNFHIPLDFPPKMSIFPPLPGDIYPPSGATFQSQSPPYPFNSPYGSSVPLQEGDVGFGYYPGLASGYPAQMGYGYPVQPAHRYG